MVIKIVDKIVSNCCVGENWENAVKLPISQGWVCVCDDEIQPAVATGKSEKCLQIKEGKVKLRGDWEDFDVSFVSAWQRDDEM